MFSFHRPKVYRSTTGCCICKAKSSSSRFTDSKKYENDFVECFKLAQPRQGEICNACVLLVKRWKKLPVGSERNWKHVVDARAGPGMKSMSKFKSRARRLEAENLANGIGVKPTASSNAGSVTSLASTTKKTVRRDASPSYTDDDEEDEDEDGEEDEVMRSGDSSRAASPRDGVAGCSGDEIAPIRNKPMAVEAKSRRCKQTTPSRRKRRIVNDADEDEDDELMEQSDFLSSDYWTKEATCCGTIFRGVCGEIVIDARMFKPCSARLAKRCRLEQHKESPNAANGSGASVIVVDNSTGKLFSDSSSDSGYDESSNQGTAQDGGVIHYRNKDQITTVITN